MMSRSSLLAPPRLPRCRFLAGLPCVAAPRLAALAEGAPAVEEMMRSVAANGALVGSEEVGGGAFLEAVLHRSLNL